MFSSSTSDSLFNSAFRIQVIAALTANLITISHGIGLGWAAPMIRLLQSEESPLGYQITMEEASWVGSLVSFGGVFGAILYGLIIDRIGRKKSLILLACPHLTFWIIVFLATKVHHFYIARFIAGLTGGGAFVVIPIFVAEIANNKIRGRLGTLFILFYNVGILFGYILTSYLTHTTLAGIMMIIPVCYMFIILLYPETPQHMLRNGLEEEAENALKFYKNFKIRSKEDQQTFDDDFREMKSVICASANADNRVTLKDFRTPRAIKGMTIGIALMTLNQFSGQFSILSYSSTIFDRTGSNIDPNVSTIIIGIIQFIGTYSSTLMVDHFGRKILLIVSAFGMCFGLSATGVFAYLSNALDLSEFGWVPLLTLSFVVFICSIGISAVPFVVLVEILPTKIRSIGTMFCLCYLSFDAFVMLKIFPVLLEKIGLDGVMWFCASVCALGGLFAVAAVPETKGKSLDEKDNATETESSHL